MQRATHVVPCLFLCVGGSICCSWVVMSPLFSRSLCWQPHMRFQGARHRFSPIFIVDPSWPCCSYGSAMPSQPALKHLPGRQLAGSIIFSGVIGWWFAARLCFLVYNAHGALIWLGATGRRTHRQPFFLFLRFQLHVIWGHVYTPCFHLPIVCLWIGKCISPPKDQHPSCEELLPPLFFCAVWLIC